jgi:hypothetical protein
MSNKRLFFLALHALTLHVTGSTPANQSSEAVSVGHLRCEQRENPAGVDRPNPLLSWRIQSDHRNIRQKAYRILAASDPAKLSHDEGDLWDSGMVTSGDTDQIAYQGKQLISSQRVTRLRTSTYAQWFFPIEMTLRTRVHDTP